MLPRQLNLAEIEKYARRFATAVCSSFFTQKERISGQEIVGLPIEKQVSLMVIKNIFIKWQLEAANLRSPFFDYTNAEVQNALKSFMNVVSRHISIARKHFEPLLADAVQETLVLTLAPANYFNNLFIQKQKNFSVETDLKPLLKYFKVHRKLVEELVRRLSGVPMPSNPSAVQELIRQLAGEKALLDDENEVIASLSRTLPAEKNQLLQIVSPSSPEDPLDFSSDTINPLAFENTKISFGVENDEPPVTPPYQEKKPELLAKPTPAKEEPQATPLNARFAGEADQRKPSLNEILAQQQPKAPSVSDMYRNARIQSLNEFIPVNKRYQFINELFRGNAAEFAEAIEAIDRCTSYNQAMLLIRDKYLPKYGWDFSKDEVKEFYELIGRKF
ncbi:MAG: hypothetical protein RMJ44_01860 [Cytophagales bacterium]|nr:hypothetical protein [Bernardetiaceae bacterium]MDW8209807.1 hypothetical protein [Cytophagales bacterium]